MYAKDETTKFKNMNIHHMISKGIEDYKSKIILAENFWSSQANPAILFGNTCLFVPNKEETQLCESLARGVLKEGLIRTHYYLQQYLFQFMEQYMSLNGKSKKIKEFFNSKTFREFHLVSFRYSRYATISLITEGNSRIDQRNQENKMVTDEIAFTFICLKITIILGFSILAWKYFGSFGEGLQIVVRLFKMEIALKSRRMKQFMFRYYGPNYKQALEIDRKLQEG